VRSYGKSPPVVVGEPKPPLTDLLSEEPILFDQIGERIPLLVIEPPVRARSNNRRTDTSITSGRLYHGRGIMFRNAGDPELGHYVLDAKCYM